MNRRVHIAVFLLAPLGLAACADPASLAVGGVSVVTVIDSGKTMTDHAMSYATGDDCSFRNSLRGDAWCQPIPLDVPARGPLVCYQSIARVTCYDVENRFETPTRRAP